MENSYNPLELRENSEFISEEDFREIVEPFAKPLLSLMNHAVVSTERRTSRIHSMNFLARVIKDASDLENLLDRYDASENLKWVYFREFTASLKNFSKASFLLEELHWTSRFDNVCMGVPDLEKEFLTLRIFFVDSISKFFQLLGQEADRLGLRAPEEAPLSAYGAKIKIGKRLPHSIEQKTKWDALQTARRIAYRFVELAQADARLIEKVVDGKKGMMPIYAPLSLNERKTRRLATVVHNLLSWYDSYLRNHAIEKEFPELRDLRSVFSCLLSLLKISTIMLHYYERHLLGWPPTAAKLREVVPLKPLLEEVLSAILLWTDNVFKHGEKTAAELLNIF